MIRTNTLRWVLGLTIAGALAAGSLAACGRDAGSQGSGNTAMNQEGGSSAPEAQKVTVPAGTDLVASLRAPLSTERNHAGDTFHATLTEPVAVPSGTVLPTGATVTGKLTEVRDGGADGGAKLTLEVTEVGYPAGESHDVRTAPLELVDSSSTEKSLEKVAAGAVGGGVIGGVIGGKKGAAIGAAVGAGAGTIVAIATKDDQIELPAGQKLRFALREPVELPLTAATTP